MTDLEREAREVEAWLFGSQDWLVGELRRIVQGQFDPDRIQREAEELRVHMECVEFISPSFEQPTRVEFEFHWERENETFEIRVEALEQDRNLTVTNMRLNRSIRF